MPWDHPFLLEIPVEWNQELSFPLGSGIRDRDNYLCVVKNLKVNVRLSDFVCEAVDKASKNPGVCDEQSAAICKSLLWNAWRILPGIYETLLTLLIERLREESIGVFLEHGKSSDSLAGNDGDMFLVSGHTDAINELLPECLPHPIGELVDVHVFGFEVESEHVMAVHQKIHKAREHNSKGRIELQKYSEQVLNQIHALFTEGRQFDSVQHDNLSVTITKRLQTAEQTILQAASTAANSIVVGLKEFKSGGPKPVMKEIILRINNNRKEFNDQTEQRFDVLRRQVEEVRAIFTDKTTA